MDFTAERLTKLRLVRTRGVGPKSVRQLLQRYANPTEALAQAANWQRPTHIIPTLAELEREIKALSALGGTMVFWDEPAYPAQLTPLPDAPLILSVLGNPEVLHQRQIGVVGNRAASAAGLDWTRQMATELAAQGLIITSGLARGIDTAAHTGALQSEKSPCTVAVVAGGLDTIYPPENAKLRAAIIERGAVVSEHPWGMPPTATLFPQRNRIIAGLSVGVVVSEAPRHSGSLITAEYALEYGREVFAVPGSPSEARSSGPNWLLKNGATLIEGTADILNALPQTPAPYIPRAVKQAKIQPSLFADTPPSATDETEETELDMEANESPRTRLYALLGSAPVPFDTLIRKVGLNEAELNGLLIELELEGHAAREADGRWRRG
jgi:DNA processing protein